ncbi:hypothetical protein EU523_01775, partial [Candidatus Heimdallarchaeota archaeon]
MTEQIKYFHCPKCGKKIVLLDGIESTRCNNCKSTLIYRNGELETGKRIPDSQLAYYYKKPRNIHNTLGKKRVFFWYWLFGLFTFGIGTIVYLFRCMQSLSDHETFPEVEKDSMIIVERDELLINFKTLVNQEHVSSFSFLLLLFTIPYDLIQAAYNKYSLLYNHLKNQSKTTAPVKPPH